MDYWVINFSYVLMAEKKVKFDVKVEMDPNTTTCKVKMYKKRAGFHLSLTDGHIVGLTVVAGKGVVGDYSNYRWDFRESNPNWNPQIADWRISTFDPTIVEDAVRAKLQDL